MLDAVVLSDIHLGAGNCQTDRLSELLQRIDRGTLGPARNQFTTRLILNGDLFDSLNLCQLTERHWDILRQLRQLSKRIETIWLTGNHDGQAELVSLVLGVPVLDEYILESGSQNFLVLHGHIFDRFIEKHPRITALADGFYRFLQRLDPSHQLARMAKQGSKTFLRCAKVIEEGATALARRRGCQGAICGHTHHACTHNNQPISYFNSGCWTELPCTYLTVSEGNVQLHAFEMVEKILSNIVNVSCNSQAEDSMQLAHLLQPQS